MECVLRLSRLSAKRVMVPQTEQKARAKGTVHHVVARKSLLKRILLAAGGLASMVFGTYLIVYAVLDWGFGPLPSFSFAISPANGLIAGGLEDLFLIVAGIGFWVLGVIGLKKALKEQLPARTVVKK